MNYFLINSLLSFRALIFLHIFSFVLLIFGDNSEVFGAALSKIVEPISGNIHDSNGLGWGQFLSGWALMDFFTKILATVILSASIAFHPSIVRKCDTLDDAELPKTIFIYGLIGMIVGFLVLRSGPQIGFVIFGIGGLIRFRTILGSSKDTGRVILITLMGLCIGLNLPHVAVFSAASAWALIYFLERNSLMKMTVILDSSEQIEPAVIAHRQHLVSQGFNIISEKRNLSKIQFEILFKARGKVSQSYLETSAANTLEDANLGQIEWENI